MAERLHDDFERIRRIELVGNLFLETGYSTRTLARYISTDNRLDFKISNATVSKYINDYKNKHADKAEQIDCLIDANKGSTVDNPEDVERVYKVAKYVLEDYSIQDIAHNLNVSYWTIYYDINIRLKKLDPKLFSKIKTVCDNHARSHNVNNDLDALKSDIKIIK